MLLQDLFVSSGEETLASLGLVESSALAQDLSHDKRSDNIVMFPGNVLESKGDLGLWRFRPVSVFTTNVLRWLSLELVLWDGLEFTNALLNQLNKFLMVVDTRGNNQALVWSDVVHHEVLHGTGVDLTNLRFSAEAWHAEGVVAVGCSEKHFLVIHEGVEL